MPFLDNTNSYPGVNRFGVTPQSTAAATADITNASRSIGNGPAERRRARHASKTTAQKMLATCSVRNPTTQKRRQIGVF